MVISTEKQLVKIYYHMNKGEISPKVKQIDRMDMIGSSKSIDNGADKEKDNPIYIKELNQLQTMEKECYRQIQD